MRKGNHDTSVTLGPACFLRGKTVPTGQNKPPVHAFLGVPYAAPPVGRLRFSAPEKLNLWTGTRKATEYGPVCPQDERILKGKQVNSLTPMSEDCLYLNIWTPSLEKTSNRPVMLFIHGGAYVSGCSNRFDGTALAALEGVVFISINYRLGALGFMSTDDEAAPGNYGILDQIEALKWTWQYIRNFGGEPDNITIFGQSAGGRSVSMMMLSDLTRGLFRRAISESGVATNPSGIWSPPRSRHYIQANVRKLGCNSTSSKDIVSFLRSVPVEDLLTLGPPGEAFAPVVDGHVLKDTPLNLYRRGKFHQVDYMLGFNSHEGCMFVLPALKPPRDTDIQAAKQYVDTIVKDVFFKDRADAASVSLALQSKYLQNINNGSGDIPKALVQLYGDLRYVAPSIGVANIHSGVADTYLYKFEHRFSYSRLPGWVGADHTNELPFVFGLPFLNKKKFTDDERKLSYTMMRCWAQFAKTGNPNSPGLPQWPKYSRKSAKFLHFTGGSKSAISSHHQRSLMDFWNNNLMVQSKL